MLKRILFLSFAFNALPSVSWANIDIPTGSTVIFPKGSKADIACSDFFVSGKLDFGDAALSSIKDLVINTQGSVNGSSSTLHLTGNWTNNGLFQPGSSNLIVEDGCDSIQSKFTGSTVFNNVTIRSANGKSVILSTGSTLTINGTLQILGSPNHPITLSAENGGQIILGPTAQLITQNSTVTAPLTQMKNAVSVPSNNHSILIILIISIISASITFFKFNNKK